MKRKLCMLLGGLFVAAGLAACDDPSGGDQQPPPAPQSQPTQ